MSLDLTVDKSRSVQVMAWWQITNCFQNAKIFYPTCFVVADDSPHFANWGLNNMPIILQTKFWNSFPWLRSSNIFWEKNTEVCSYVLRMQLTISQHRVRASHPMDAQNFSETMASMARSDHPVYHLWTTKAAIWPPLSVQRRHGLF